MEQDAVFEEFGLNPEAYKTSGEDAEGGGAAAPDAGAGAAEEGGAPVPGSGTPAEESGAAAQEEAGEETRDGLLPNAEASEAALAEASRREKAASEAAEFRTQALQADNETYVQKLTDEYGITFYYPTEEEIAQLQEAVQPVYENFVSTHEFGSYAAAIAEICAAN